MALLATCASWAAERPKTAPPRPAPALILESANNNENSLVNGEFISILRGNVVFVYDDIRIRSDQATWWRRQGTIDFKNNVKVVRGRSRILCNAMHFTKENNLLEASGNFDYYDTTEQSRLRADRADYRIAAKVFHCTGGPVLIRYDTARAETLTIRSIAMNYLDSLKRATAIDSVRITKGKLAAACRLAYYYTAANRAELRGSPRVRYDIHRLDGDTINLNFSKESLRDASIVGSGHGIYADPDTGGARKGDTSYTHLWGDSLYMAVSDSGRLEVIWSVGKASSKSFTKSEPSLANTANGKIMMLGFNRDGNVKNLKIWGNARSTYYTEDNSGRGCNEVSGDSVSVLFARGRANFVTLAGSTRGIYFPIQ